ncbi:hypothetical protein EYC84_006751 [Monilinia fructicola]|uniref:Uncharacterized protein n=2 Tax=Monilinia fructicola TaxID=38448 RepID=A0A5M9K733_MONFR|nr:hypothetical protein EYC84_006751 [Monilinia fructicola]
MKQTGEDPSINIYSGGGRVIIHPSIHPSIHGYLHQCHFCYDSLFLHQLILYEPHPGSFTLHFPLKQLSIVPIYSVHCTVISKPADHDDELIPPPSNFHPSFKPAKLSSSKSSHIHTHHQLNNLSNTSRHPSTSVTPLEKLTKNHPSSCIVSQSTPPCDQQFALPFQLPELLPYQHAPWVRGTPEPLDLAVNKTPSPSAKKANEDYTIRQRENEKLLELKKKITEQRDHLKKLEDHISEIERQSGGEQNRSQNLRSPTVHQWTPLFSKCNEYHISHPLCSYLFAPCRLRDRRRC